MTPRFPQLQDQIPQACVLDPAPSSRIAHYSLPSPYALATPAAGPSQLSPSVFTPLPILSFVPGKLLLIQQCSMLTAPRSSLHCLHTSLWDSASQDLHR